MSALKNEIFRPLTTIVVPGTLALGPYILLACHYIPNVKSFWSDSSYTFGFIILILILAVGLILENIGSCLENIFDHFLDNKYKYRFPFWQRYLKLKIQDEYVGQRYLRTIHIRFKFELSVCPAIIFFTIGLAWLNGVDHFWQASAAAWIYSGLFALLIFMLWQAYDSAYVLGTLHRAITNAVNNKIDTSEA